MRNNVDRVLKEWGVFKIVWYWRRHFKLWITNIISTREKSLFFLPALSYDDAILVSLAVVILINMVAFAKISTSENVVLI